MIPNKNSNTMRAVVVEQSGGPEVMTLKELPIPQAGPGQVLVRVQAIGVNPVDTYIRAGLQGYSPRLPYTPGLDAAGVVKAVGAGVEGVAAGDRVYTSGSLSGTYAQFALCSASQVHHLPGQVTYVQGAGINVPYATAYRALFQRAAALPGETVLIHGASGGVGIAATQLAAAAGLTVFGTAGTDNGRRLVDEQGAERIFDHRQPEHLQQVLEATGGRGVDIIVEMLANVNLGRDLEILAPGGRVVIVGSRGEVQINPRDLMRRDAAIVGMSLMNLKDEDGRVIHAALIAGLGNGTLRPVIQNEIPLAEAARAHKEVIEQASLGKIVLIP